MPVYIQKYLVVALYVRFEAPEGEVQVVKHIILNIETITTTLKEISQESIKVHL